MAVCHPDYMFNSDNDQSLDPNRLQRKLFSGWEECLDRITKKPLVLGINGEPVDGDNFKQIGVQSWTTNFNDQAENACELFKMFGAENIVMTRGSGYHVTRGATNFDELVARKIGARRYRAYYSEEVTPNAKKTQAALTDYFALFRIHGKLFNMTHHVGHSKKEMYRSTPLASEMVFTKLNQNEYHKFDVITRGHVHYYLRLQFPHSEGFITPAWKFPDGHLFRHGMGGTAPNIGMVEVIVESNGKIIIEPYIIDIDIKPSVLEF